MTSLLSIPLASGPTSLHDGEPLVESDPGSDVDDPPDGTPVQQDFQRRGIPRLTSDHRPSLLTKALQGDGTPFDPSNVPTLQKRPSISSNVSVASTAELTCDTGNTSPARVPSPSPPHPGMTYLLGRPDANEKKVEQPTVRPRRISFACAEPPKVATSPKAQDIGRRPTIKFACQAPPPRVNAEPKTEANVEALPRKTSIKFACASKPRQQPPAAPAPSAAKENASAPAAQPCDIATMASSRYTAAAADLSLEGFRFHEFASDEPQPDDWILQDSASPKKKLTMGDILEKELAIRKLAKEALEEDDGQDDAEQDEDADADEEEDDDDDEVEDDDEDEDEDDADDDGYNTDNEQGFADSDVSDNEGDDDDVEVDVPVWFPKPNPSTRVSPGLEVYRPATSIESNSSLYSAANMHVIPTHRMKIPRGKPNLPDSTDFVCGTFDEDRVVEDMYLTVLAARKRSKLHAIPQDIDPSFPASDPEDEEDNDDVSNKGDCDSDEHPLGFKLDDIHHGQPRLERRRRRSDACSPRTRYRSPPPKKHTASPQKPRGHSPRPLFGRTPPRRLVSPAPAHLLKSPRASPVHKIAPTACKPLATRPGLTATKSLPRPGAFFPGQLKRRRSANSSKGVHTRGAIDIVKGLEEKRQRRREKYLQKYCTRARKGQIPEKKPVPRGQGAERMKELGLYMAGKLGPGYVLSI